MINSRNCWICRKISGKQHFLQSSNHLTSQLCLAKKVAKTYIIISTLTLKGRDVRIWQSMYYILLPSAVNSDFSYCLTTLLVPSLCFFLQTNSYIGEVNQWSLREISEGFYPRFPSLGTCWNIISICFCLYRLLKYNRPPCLLKRLFFELDIARGNSSLIFPWHTEWVLGWSSFSH